MIQHAIPRNPFITRHTRPGVLPPLDTDGQPVDVAGLTAMILRHGGASIEGPHGTGKSTLLAALAQSLARADRLGGIFRLQSGHDVPSALRGIHRAAVGTFVCLDGLDVFWSLGILARSLAWSRGVGLVVTSHGPAGLPYVIRTTATLPLLAAIVKRLPDHGGLIDADDLADALARHPGNIREALLDLYDRFEHRARMSR